MVWYSNRPRLADSYQTVPACQLVQLSVEGLVVLISGAATLGKC